MRCEEVIRELAAPTDDRDAAALAEHLAGCPGCAGWARRAAQLDRLWEATRPLEPAPEVWDALWAGLSQSLGPAPATEVESTMTLTPLASRNGSPSKVKDEPPAMQPRRSSQSRPWSFPAIGSFGSGLAAAMLLAVGLAWGVWVNEPVEIEEGHMVVIRANWPVPTVVDTMPEETPYGVDPLYVMLNEVESMADLTVAMTE
jgi:hypothetical protein